LTKRLEEIKKNIRWWKVSKSLKPQSGIEFYVELMKGLWRNVNVLGKLFLVFGGWLIIGVIVVIFVLGLKVRSFINDQTT